jgi:hypothetical protein
MGEPVHGGRVLNIGYPEGFGVGNAPLSLLPTEPFRAWDRNGKRPVLVIPLSHDGTVPEEIVERVAKAYWGTRVATRGRMWSAATPSAKHAALDQARAALAALSAPGAGTET